MSLVYNGLHEALQSVLLQRLGWSELRDVQELTCRAVWSGSDVLVLAPTAGGKTEAALIPVTDTMLKEGLNGVACIYISPLKALINDQEDRFLTFAVSTGLLVRKWHGDVSKGDRAWAAGEPPHFLMITPESLEVLMLERLLSADLKNLRFVVIDEVHAFVESERGVHLRCLLDRLDEVSGRKVQRIGLSATVGNPDDVLRWLSAPGKAQEVVQVPVIPREKKFSFTVEPNEGRRHASLARVVSGKKAIVFVNSRSDAENVITSLRGRVDHLSVHHSSLSQETRREAESAFSREGSACIVCTSSLELGIDIGDLDIVVQMGPPNSVSSFLQRMGRSGRRGQPPFVAFILRDPCELLCSVAVIECAGKKEIEPLIPHVRPYNVLVQQLLLEMLRKRRVSTRRLLSVLRSLTPFKGIPAIAMEEIVKNLMTEEYLVADGEMLMLGPRSEREFGRANWRDLYSVIHGGGEFRAVTPEGEVVGRLDARFVNSRNSAGFQLGGRGWRMITCDEVRNQVVVVPGSEQKGGIFWTGGAHGYSEVVCRGVSRIIRRGKSILPLPDDARLHLARVISKVPTRFHPRDIVIEAREGAKGLGFLLLTFRNNNFGKLYSSLLTHTLEPGTRISKNDFSLLVRGVRGDDPFGTVVHAAQKAVMFSQKEIESAIQLPFPDEYKFGSLLPVALFREMVLTDVYHIDDFMAELSSSRVFVSVPEYVEDSVVPDVPGVHIHRRELPAPDTEMK